MASNTDDHAKNHAAFWDGQTLNLTPAYDITPQLRTVGEVAQAMEIAPSRRLSRLEECVAAAPVYQLTGVEAREVIDRQLQAITEAFDEAADMVELTQAERLGLWGSQILNRYALDGYAAT